MANNRIVVDYHIPQHMRVREEGRIFFSTAAGFCSQAASLPLQSEQNLWSALKHIPFFLAPPT